MSFIDDMLAAAKEVKIAEVNRPREVQTIEQRSVETRQNVGAVPQEPKAASAASPSTGIMAKIPGGQKTLMVIGGLLIAAVVAKKVL